MQPMPKKQMLLKRETQAGLKALSATAEIVKSTYGLIAHGILVKSVNTSSQKDTIEKIKAANSRLLSEAEITYVGWLIKDTTHKTHSSLVIEFANPDLCDAVITSGLHWQSTTHSCTLYDRSCRMKQCFRCYKYGHIGNQCRIKQICGYCSAAHESKDCPSKDSTRKCPACKGSHTAWSDTCPARKREKARVAEAKACKPSSWREYNLTPPSTSPNHSFPLPALPLPGPSSARSQAKPITTKATHHSNPQSSPETPQTDAVQRLIDDQLRVIESNKPFLARARDKRRHDLTESTSSNRTPLGIKNPNNRTDRTMRIYKKAKEAAIEIFEDANETNEPEAATSNGKPRNSYSLRSSQAGTNMEPQHQNE